ncbi:MAG TPA: helix-turn-helix domain-containing protein [Candidatus Nanopelagicaceae bacterium]|nr:helix-turn-helix domain-containing protein [Candidatus Nanopelagicaceae bacterium]
MPEKKEKKKPIFEKVGLVFRNSTRIDIVRELSTNSQRPIDLANKLEVDRQNINYHISALKRGGIIKTQKMEVSQEEASKLKGAIVNKVTKEGKLKISYGVELTKNGKDVVNQFVDPLYEELIVEEEHKDESVNKKKKEESKL